MAKKSTEELAPVGSSALATASSLEWSMERPSFIDPNDRSGTEGITSDDILLPRLTIAQAMSPQMTPGSDVYLEDLKVGQMFNDVTGDIYGAGPLSFIIVKRQVTNIEWDPEQRGVPIDRNVPAGDPRLEWTEDENGDSIPPKATTYEEFFSLIEINGNLEPIVISVKCTNKQMTRAAKSLNGYVSARGKGPLYAGVYTVAVKQAFNSQKQAYGVFQFKNNYFVKDENVYKYAKSVHDTWKEKVIETRREATTNDDPDSFDPNELEKQAQAKPEF